MKKTSFMFSSLSLLAMIVFMAGYLQAGNIEVGTKSTTTLKVTESSYTILGLTNTLSGIEFMQVKTKEGYFTHFRINEYGYSTEEGNPRLPVIKKLIEVPLGAICLAELLSYEVEEVNLADYGIADLVMPAQPSLSKGVDNPDDVEFVYNPSTYAQDAFWGPEMINVVDLGVIRGVRMARLEIAPVYYNPVKNTLKVYTNIEVKVNFTGGNIGETMAQKESMFSPHYAAIYGQLINYKPLGGFKDFITDEPPTYIIVADPMFEDALSPFIEWKTKKGFLVVEAYTDDPLVGSTTTSIKNYLQDFYDNPPEGYNAQSYVLFVGDDDQIPAFDGSAGYHITDLYYCTYDGTADIYPDCYYGRFSANNLDELQPQIDKTLEYEQYLFPDPSFLDQVVMVAGADNTFAATYGNGQINYGTENYFNLSHGLTSHTYLQPEPAGASYAQDIRSNISDGVAYANYTAHCNETGWYDPAFNTWHIDDLANANKYPLMVGNCCLSAAFENTCFGEEIVRAENKGALGYIGGSNNTLWDEDFWWGVGFESISANPTYNADHLGAYDRLFHENGEVLEEWYVTQGQMPSAGNLAVTQAGSSYETYYWEIYHLMGDPSVMVYFSQPPAATAIYQDLLPLGSSTFSVTTDPYAYVAISRDGVLHGCGIADESGNAEVNLFNPIVVPGTADIVITGQNLMPYMGEVIVSSPEGAYVLMEAFTIDDSQGNDNGLVDYSEYILLDVSLENYGNETATDLLAIITTSDEYITLNSDSHDWPDISAGNTSLQEGAFAFTVDDWVPDQHTVMFDIEITDGTDTWTGNFMVPLNAPLLTYGAYWIDDNEGNGNGNGRLDPGETADIIIPNLNEGGSDAINAVSTLVSSNPFLTINNATFDLETLAAGEGKDAIFNVSVDVATPIGEIVQTNYEIIAEPYSAAGIVSLTVGLVVEDFETGDFGSYPWEFAGNAQWEIDDENPYEGDYSARSGLISNNSTTSMMVTLDVSTDDEISFYYKVSSEDSYDFLRFYVDGTMKDEWAGEIPWSLASFDVSAGVHTFKWEYAKDFSVSSGSDCAWVDFIVLPPVAGSAPLGVVASATPQEICTGESTQLAAYTVGGQGSYTYEWMPETGLDDPTIANPVASPEVTTTYYVVVNDGDATVTDNVEVEVHPQPEQPIVTQSGYTLVSNAINGNQWYDSDGPIAGATGQNYTPTTTDDYYTIVTNQYGCESEPSEPYYFIYTGIIDIADGQKVNIYPNPFNGHFVLDYSLPSNSQVKISMFNSFGQLLTVLENEQSQIAGNHRINFDASRFEGGILYLKIETADYSVVKRLVHAK
jgi:hypothetical protein